MGLAVGDFASSRRLLVARSGAWLTLCIFEALATSWLFDLPYWFSAWGNPFSYLRQIAVWAIVSAAAFGMLAWPRRSQLGELWRREQEQHDWWPALSLNLLLFVALSVATATLSAYASSQPTPPWLPLVAYALLLIATSISLLRIDVALASSSRLARAFRDEIAVAGAVGAGVLVLAAISRQGWDVLAEATLQVAKLILEAYEIDVALYPAERMLRIGDFAVIVTRNCSGFEGIALIVAFLSIYLWVFRDGLRFPRAFLLFPVGIIAIWLLNALRIALLASLGAHVSPQMAIKGFHSQAGWIAFLLATLGIMALANASAFFAAGDRTRVVPVTRPDNTSLIYLGPFMALMAASVAMAATAPHDQPLYPLKVAAVGAVLWYFRDSYMRWSRRATTEAVLAGLIVGAAWIYTDPRPAEGDVLAGWLESQTPLIAAAWLLCRVIGASVLVPIAEELAFRGFLHRWLIARQFENVAFERTTLLAFCLSSALFGLMHDRWLAAMLAGAVFAAVMIRTRSIAGPIAAHMTANALICLWALAFRQWSLL